MVESEKDPRTAMSANKVCCVLVCFCFFFPFVFSLPLALVPGGNGGGEKRIKLEGKWCFNGRHLIH